MIRIPTSTDAVLSFLGKITFWKSSSHVLGQAVELKFDYLLSLGVVTKDNFFYEVGRTNKNGADTVIETDQKCLEEIAGQIIAAKQKFERLVVSKENLLEMFKHNKYKLYHISSNITDGASATVYRCGPFIDICVGPHVRDTGKIGGFKIEEVRNSQEPICAAFYICSLGFRLEVSTWISLACRDGFDVPYLRH